MTLRHDDDVVVTMMIVMHDARVHDDHVPMMRANDHFVRVRRAGNTHESREPNRQRYDQFFHHDLIISAR